MGDKIIWVGFLVVGGEKLKTTLFRHKEFCFDLEDFLRIGEIWFWCCVKTVTTCEPGVEVEVEPRRLWVEHSLNDGQQWGVAGVIPSLRTQNLQENDLAP